MQKYSALFIFCFTDVISIYVDYSKLKQYIMSVVQVTKPFEINNATFLFCFAWLNFWFAFITNVVGTCLILKFSNHQKYFQLYAVKRHY